MTRTALKPWDFDPDWSELEVDAEGNETAGPYLQAQLDAYSAHVRSELRRKLGKLFPLMRVAEHRGRHSWTVEHQATLEWARVARLFRFVDGLDHVASLGHETETEAPEPIYLSELRTLINENGGPTAILSNWNRAVKSAVDEAEKRRREFELLERSRIRPLAALGLKTVTRDVSPDASLRPTELQIRKKNREMERTRLRHAKWADEPVQERVSLRARSFTANTAEKHAIRALIQRNAALIEELAARRR